jgi:hypothetical protein
MKCPTCQQELSTERSRPDCPHCGEAIAIQPPSTPEVAAQAPLKLNWPVFFAILFAPVVLTIVAVQVMPASNDASPAVAVIFGAVSGILCGFKLGRRFGKSPESRIGLGILFSLIMVVVCVGMSCFGCLASGYHLDLR